MATRLTAGKPAANDFVLEGTVDFQQSEGEHSELDAHVFAFNRLGEVLGGAALNTKGQFKMALRLKAPSDIQLIAGPGDDATRVRQSSGHLQALSAKEWIKEGRGYVIRAQLVIPRLVWWPWYPARICISGHVRKIGQVEGSTAICPVPFVKVEIFDVDREACWWPPLRNWWESLIDRPVFRIPDLLKDPPLPPRPFPGPDPFPDLRLDPRVVPQPHVFEPGAAASLNPQPLPPRFTGAPLVAAPVARQRALPGAGTASLSATSIGASAQSRVGEARLMDSAIASRLDRLTLTSKIAPWLIFPNCFYSKQMVCETYTDCDGYFRCCFNWWPLHVRRGRLRFDGRPDIVVRVTQIINGVATVIYMDPYTSTRWDVSSAHIDLFLDNEEVRCGRGCHPQPEGAQVFFNRIGNDNVYRIDQANGLYTDSVDSLMAYGHNLRIHGVFGDALSGGAPKRYYRLSYARQGSADTDFKYIDADLTDTRVDKATSLSTDQFLGPQLVNGTTTLYEVRNTEDYLWYNTDWIGSWWTPPVEDNTGTYVLRLELFDENGAYLDTASGQVDYRDGTVVPPAVLPAMVDHSDLVITLDNKPPEVDLTIPAVLNACGVIPWSPTLTLDFHVVVSQANHRLFTWTLEYAKGVNPAWLPLPPNPDPLSHSGSLASVNQTLADAGAPLLAGLTTTCAFALRLSAWAHIRNGYGRIYYREQTKAIAIEKCGGAPG